jgi:4-hydroxy-tetrahydrodipicolinate synthase
VSVPTGVIPPLVTPLTPEREVDEASVERLVEHLVGAGVDGLFVGGSTGEVALLGQAHQDRMLRATVRAAGGRVPGYAGTIDTGTERVLDRARAAQAAGAAAVVATPPFYVAPHPDEVVQHYRRLASALDVPVVAYDIPSATHSPLPLAALGQIAADGTVCALKDSRGDLAKFRAAIETVRGTGIGLLTGSEVFADLALQIGGTGIVPGLGNVDPHGYVAIQRAVDAGDLGTADEEQRRLIRLFRIIDVADRSRIGFTAGALGAFKAALVLRGVIAGGATMTPLGALSDDEVEQVGAILRSEGLSTVTGAAL